MITAKFVPTTASPGPGDYFNAYKHLIEAGHREIISIHMTAKASGGFQAAALAQSMLKESDPEINLEVIDSRTTSLSQGWMVLEAARAALAGLRLNEITDIVKNMIPISHMIQTADTLRYLYLGGRIGKAQSLLGSMLNIKPLIGIENGEIAPLGKAHSRGQAYQQMAEMMAQAIGQGKAKVAYVHAGALHEVEKIKELVETKVNVVESMFAELSPALAVHTGPGTAGLCYYPVKD
jgi:DegV family protein with EDD domain